MRFSHLVVSILFLSPIAFAKAMSFKEVMIQSAAVRKEIANAKTIAKKIEELKKWESTLQSVLSAHEQENPKEGTAEEDLIGRLSISMEPVFDLAKEGFSKENCKKASHQIEIEDRDNTKADPSQLSDDAKEALAVLKLFCAN